MNGLRKNATNHHFLAFLTKKANFGQFLAKMGETGIFFKKALEIFFSRLQALTKCKVSEKVMNGFWENALRTYERTDRRDS